MLSSLFLAVSLLGAIVARAPYIGAATADVKTGKTIFADGADNPVYPSSVTKLMTAYLVLDDVKAGKYKLTDLVTATPDVNNSEASWVGLKAGETMTVNDMLTALMVESANDVAIALAVKSEQSRLGASEAQRKEQTGSHLMGFVARMNGKAAEFGMKKTTYYNPNGLPPKKRYPWKNHNITTAGDQLKLALRLMKDHPEILQFTSIKTCDLVKTAGGYRTSVTRKVNEAQKTTTLAAGEKIVKQMRNHNHVMVQDHITYMDAKKANHKLPRLVDANGKEIVDGLKTGYTNAGGSSVVVTGKKGDKRVVVVVLGSGPELDAKGKVLNPSAKVRDRNARKLLNDALGAVAW